MAESSTPSPVPAAHPSQPAETKDESNLCRICRGEATEQEPLYHPCKCSGSIMHVHQECLMEWLSHSQKKHCELCKTSFRFTKLYAADMPEKLPTGVFLRRAAAHVAQHFVTWMRGCLVFSIWAVWLPWTMRFVWWGLFWLADVGWVKDPHTYSHNGTIHANTTLPADNTTAFDARSAVMEEVLRGPAILRVTTWMLQTLISSPSKGVMNDLTPENHMQGDLLANNSTQLLERGTLLCGVGFLTSLTSSPLANRIVIDILEGLVITLALVALIILVLLIREWVVQQQPIVNLQNDNEEMRQALQRHAHEGEQQPPQRPPRARRRTSVLNREPDAFVKNILQEMEHGNGNRPDLQKASESQIRNLHARTITGQSMFKAEFLERLKETNGPANTTQAEAAILLSDIEEASQALRIAYAEAVRDEDLQKLRTLQRNLHSFRQILALLPEDLVKPIDNSSEEIKSSMKSMFPMVRIKSRLRDLGPLSQRLRNGTAQRSAGTQMQPGAEVTDQRDASPQERPTMPPRDESFVATEIQRDLQEGHSDDPPVDVSIPKRARADDSPKALDEHLGSDTDSYENVEKMTDEIAKESAEAASALTENTNDSPANEVLLDNSQRQDAAGTPDLSSSDVHAPERENPSIGGQSEQRSSQDLTVGDTNPVHGAQNHAIVHGTVDGDRPEDAPAPVQKDLVEWAADWLWGDLHPSQRQRGNAQEGLQADREEIVQAPDQPAPEPAVQEEQRELHNEVERGEEQEQAGAVAAQPEEEQPPPNEGEAAQQAQAPADAAGLFGDIEGMDDAEDLEGVMELIGMQGPLTNLLTNAMFASVFVSCTIVIAVWIPFLLGKIALIMLAHPISVIEAPLAMINFVTNVVYDLGLLMSASLLQWMVLAPMMYLVNNWYDLLPTSLAQTKLWPALELSTNDLISSTASRLMSTLRSTVEGTDVAYSTLTFDAHAAVRALEGFVSQASQQIAATSAHTAELSVKSIEDIIAAALATQQAAHNVMSYVVMILGKASNLPSSIMAGDLTITYSTPNFAQNLTSTAPEWTALDRSLATTLGYAFIAFLGALYFMRLAPVARGRQNQKIETVILEIFQQAGGITKVVLIISIEMLAFPLYCGMLWDVAMLPLFQDASIKNRIDWSKSSPWTSLFVHWFVGTAYMFHFALFVAMCRKTFRRGVLYFIRDPDDPTFHPVRDVLERSVLSQLRKILSSALIYGGLVILCIGTLVWSLEYSLRGILPIQWRPTGAANAFPYDLIVYVFIRPIAIKHFALSEWLQNYYKWFFRRCARLLCLTHFLFGDDVEDERGVIRRRGFALQPANGQWLRVPAHDGVRVPRGIQAFVKVDEDCRRLDGSEEPEYPSGKSFKGEDYSKVFAPHHFGMRLAAFIVCLWSMTALIGVLFTILPLLLGRIALSMAFGRGAPINDIYAFSVGVFMVCGTIFAVIETKIEAVGTIKAFYHDNLTSMQTRSLIGARIQSALGVCKQALVQYGPRVARCCYFYGVLGIVISLSLAALLHLYILGPIATFVYGGEHPHIIKISESLVIGIQLVRMVRSILNDHPEWRSARAVDAILEAGPSDPDLALANRYLFLPMLMFSAAAIFYPALLARTAYRIIYRTENPEKLMYIHVYSYPATLGLLLLNWIVLLLIKATTRWRMRIRDEVFLIGERLHNYGEVKPPSNAPHSSARL